MPFGNVVVFIRTPHRPIRKKRRQYRTAWVHERERQTRRVALCQNLCRDHAQTHRLRDIKQTSSRIQNHCPDFVRNCRTIFHLVVCQCIRLKFVDKLRPDFSSLGKDTCSQPVQKCCARDATAESYHCLSSDRLSTESWIAATAQEVLELCRCITVRCHYEVDEGVKQQNASQHNPWPNWSSEESRAKRWRESILFIQRRFCRPQLLNDFSSIQNLSLVCIQGVWKVWKMKSFIS